MFRFFKYDETGYTDFENSIFSNLNQSQFDRLNDKLTIEDIEYRISSIKELCENCNNSETFINETMTRRPVNRTITTAGAKGTIPATNDHTDGSWLATDLYNGEVLINTTDNVAYIRSGNEIRSWQLNPIDVIPPVAFEFIDPESLTVGNPPVEVMFYGSGLDKIMGVDSNVIEFGVRVSDFEVLGQEQISLIIDTSEADLGGSSGETLEVPFITSFDEIVKASLSLVANSIPQGDPVITSIEPYGTVFFVSGEQTVKISGNALNSRDGLSINPQNDMVTQLSHEFDENGNILAQMYIPEEVLNTHAEFVLSYDGYMSEPFQVYLTKEEIQPPAVLEITGILSADGYPLTTLTKDIVINGNNFGEQGSIMMFAVYYEDEVNHGSIIWTDTEIVISGCELAPYQGSVIEFYVASNGNTSEAFSISI